MVKAASIDQESLSHNLLGQRLGRKGRDTRERILAATQRLLDGPVDAPISLSAVAREASLAMTTLYLYFSDLTELLLAALQPIMASAEEAFAADLRTRWPDEALAEHCLTFVEAFHAFWAKHARILHLRNAYADANDARMREHRIASSQPLIELLSRQMDHDPAKPRFLTYSMATVLMTGLERLVTVTTDESYSNLMEENASPYVRNLLRSEARLLELGLRDTRASDAAPGRVPIE